MIGLAGLLVSDPVLVVVLNAVLCKWASMLIPVAGPLESSEVLISVEMTRPFPVEAEENVSSEVGPSGPSGMGMNGE